jgi:8-oxo-dGTP diphosphatase
MWALPGGFLDYGESAEDAVVRELKEETSLGARNVCQAKTYSDPDRDPRGHTVSIVYHVDAEGTLKAADDAKEAKLFKLDRLPALAFDHEKIIRECILKK